jgi:hypothetical protein
LTLAACATTAPEATFTKPLPISQHIDSNDTAVVKVDTTQGVAVIDSEKQRLSQRIKQAIDAEKKKSAVPGDKREYELDVLLTRYEKGNAFARGMLAGLGQMHIDGHIAVLALPDKAKIGEFDVKKTFAWGGLYGAATSIETVEEGFANGVAEAVTKSMP